MSLLSTYVTWFERQRLSIQIASTVVIFGLLFGLGLYTLGLGPLVIIGAVLVDHWINSDIDR